jgi:6-pyruvoyltetrahydropterin/6-carboxytetrahydropterin synthase
MNQGNFKMSFSLSVKEHVMIAHSFKGELFGPAQRLHGATYVITATFYCEKLDEHNLVIDIGEAHRVLKLVLEPLAYQNLDDLDAFTGTNTTTEYLCAWIHREMASNIRQLPINRLRIELKESHVAWATYEAAL